MGFRFESVAGWIRDVRLTRNGLMHKQTGHRIPLDPATLGDMVRWVRFDQALRKLPTLRDVPVRICFTPTRARPWYFARAIADHLGADIVEHPADADIVWAFEDSTFSQPLLASATKITINAGTTDISKSRISELMEEVFGYALGVNPETHCGAMVVKSETNGAHDGRVVIGPIPRDSGFAYQVLIDNSMDHDRVEDIRTTIMAGQPVLVFRKRRPTAERFANMNSEVEMAALGDVFTSAEIARIAAFARALRLDAGGLDILRDRTSSLLYIVDANKTDMGPPLALPLGDKLEATRLMAEALAAHIESEWSIRPDTKPSATTAAPKKKRIISKVMA